MQDIEINTTLQQIHPDKGSFAHLNGLIFYDTGNETPAFNTFSERGNILYASMLDRTAILGATDAKDARQVEKNIAFAQTGLETLGSITGFNLNLRMPVIYIASPDPGRIDIRQTLAYNSSSDSRARLEAVTREADSIGLNQLSLQHARIAQQLARTGKLFGDFSIDAGRYHQLAEVTFFLNQKHNYLQLIQANQGLDLPRHIPTVLADSMQMPSSWEEFAAMTATCPGFNSSHRFIAKSAIDAGGEVQAIFDQDTYEAAVNSLTEQNKAKRQDLQAVIQDQLSSIGEFSGIPVLIQPFIETGNNTQLEFPENFAVNMFINPDGNWNLVVASRQLYKNPERTVYLGSHWSKESEAAIVNAIGAQRLHNLAQLIFSKGYTGPIEFEGMNDNGVSEFIYDANVRLSAIMPAIAARYWLGNQGLAINSFSHFGYNGIFKFDDYGDVLRQLSEAGLLLTTETKQGIILLPDINRRKRYIAMLANMGEDQISISFRQLQKLAAETFISDIY